MIIVAVPKEFEKSVEGGADEGRVVAVVHHKLRTKQIENDRLTD